MILDAKTIHYSLDTEKAVLEVLRLNLASSQFSVQVCMACSCPGYHDLGHIFSLVSASISLSPLSLLSSVTRVSLPSTLLLTAEV